jgi:hypothetical protein
MSLIGQYKTGVNVQPIELLSHLELNQVHCPNEEIMIWS